MKKKRKPTQQWSIQETQKLRKAIYMNHPYTDKISKLKEKLNGKNETVQFQNSYGPYEDYIGTRKNNQSVKSHLSKKKAAQGYTNNFYDFIEESQLQIETNPARKFRGDFQEYNNTTTTGGTQTYFSSKSKNDSFGKSSFNDEFKPDCVSKLGSFFKDSFERDGVIEERAGFSFQRIYKNEEEIESLRPMMIEENVRKGKKSDQFCLDKARGFVEMLDLID